MMFLLVWWLFGALGGYLLWEDWRITFKGDMEDFPWFLCLPLAVVFGPCCALAGIFFRSRSKPYDQRK